MGSTQRLKTRDAARCDIRRIIVGRQKVPYTSAVERIVVDYENVQDNTPVPTVTKTLFMSPQ